MKILVTGSLGTIGRPLVTELRKRGHEVWGLDKEHSREECYVRADMAEYRQMAEAFGKVDPKMVFNLGAEFGRENGQEYPETLWKSNIFGLGNVLTLQRYQHFRLVHASTSEIYGELPVEWLTEDLPLKVPIIHKNLYALSKWHNEVQIMQAEERQSLLIMRPRFFNAYGPGELYHSYRSVVCLFCYRLLHRQPISIYKNYKRVFMWIGDFIPTLANIVDNFRAGEAVNIGGSEYRNVEDVATIAADYLKLTASERKDLFRYGTKDLHNVQNKRPNIDMAKKWLNHNPKVGLEEGIPKTIDWMKEVYHV